MQRDTRRRSQERVEAESRKKDIPPPKVTQPNPPSVDRSRPATKDDRAKDNHR